jgi:hypothetical protein
LLIGQGNLPVMEYRGYKLDFVEVTPGARSLEDDVTFTCQKMSYAVRSNAGINFALKPDVALADHKAIIDRKLGK